MLEKAKANIVPSLVPRPFPPPAFDHLQYEIQRGRPGRSGHVRCHQVDTQRVKNLDVLSCTVRPKMDVRALTRQTIKTVRCS